MRTVGTVVRGIRTGVIKEGDNLVDIVVSSIITSSQEEGFKIRNKDIIGVTEAVLAISDGNYASIDQIAKDVKNKYFDGEVGIVFPTPVSRNRFALILKGIARGCKKVYIQFSYPDDHVGNNLFDPELLEKYQINSDDDIIDENKFDELFATTSHVFTGINYVNYFREVVKAEGCNVEIFLANKPNVILEYTKNILIGDVHDRDKYKKYYRDHGALVVYGTDDLLKESISGSGYNQKYGLLGSNKATEEKVKLFPKNGDDFVVSIQNKMLELTGKKIEVLVYGDGAFKDPVGKIWELADPVVSPAFTSGLIGTPNELKLKFLYDNKYRNLNGPELNNAIKNEIKNKEEDLKGKMVSQGTTPRQLTDLIGSLCDLTSGSGDKGTPVVYIQGYFDNYADDEE